MTRILLAILIVGAAYPALAVDPREVLDDPVMEQRAREISKGLRCLVCQNQSIDDSDAELARDLRVLVRERLTSGDSDQQVVDYVVSRYGDFVLLKPPFKGATLVLWLGPAVIVAVALFALIHGFRKRAAAAPPAPAPLSAQEKQRVAALLSDETEN